MSEGHKGQKNRLGKKHTEESKLKISEKHKGLIRPPVSEETRRKISLIHKGKIVSEEGRRHMSEVRKGKKLSEEHKRKIGKSIEGKHWYTNGIKNKFCKECPD
jgi:hypothetical protein